MWNKYANWKHFLTENFLDPIERRFVELFYQRSQAMAKLAKVRAIVHKQKQGSMKNLTLTAVAVGLSQNMSDKNFDESLFKLIKLEEVDMQFGGKRQPVSVDLGSIEDMIQSTIESLESVRHLMNPLEEELRKLEKEFQQLEANIEYMSNTFAHVAKAWRLNCYSSKQKLFHAFKGDAVAAFENAFYPPNLEHNEEEKEPVSSP